MPVRPWAVVARHGRKGVRERPGPLQIRYMLRNRRLAQLP
jgi:hypothetical protein